MKKEEKGKKPTFKGVFISNERKKRQGGRIKCLDLPNKIEVSGFNQALHESEVEWQEIRRYKKEDRNRKKGPQKKPKLDVVPEKSVGAAKKSSHFKQKQEIILESKQEETKSHHQQPIETMQEAKVEQKPKKQQKISKYKIKQTSEKIQTSEKTESVLNKSVDPIAKSNERQEQEAIEKKEKDENNRDEQIRQQKEDSQNESEEEEDIYKDLEIIVARVKRQTKILYKSKPFVAIMNFVEKRKEKKKKDKKKDFSKPITQILEDFYVDIVPIHSRLPVMEMDELVDENISILSDYVFKMINYDQNGKAKELNRIIDSLSSTYIFVTFNDWDGEYPLAKIHKVLGKALTIDGECQRFLYEHGLNDFHYEKEDVIKEPLELQPSPLHKKVDRMVFTIDPATSTDLDDALSIEKQGDLYEIGIHIADVSSYMSLIDRSEIVKRTTSVYLPYKVYHMLQPHFVKICSLDPGLLRLAFTVWVTMDLEGNVIGEGRLQKNLVESRFKLSYEVVQNIITGKMEFGQFKEKYTCAQSEFDVLQQKLLTLAEIAASHRKKRIFFDVFENRELQFRSDQSLWPVQCYVDKRFAAKKMVEQFMIIGNVQSARFMVKNQPNNALVIHHPKPSRLAVNSFNDQFKILEKKFKFENVLDVQKQLLELQENEDVKTEIKQLCYFRARRVMEPAIYRKYNEIIEEEKERLNEKAKAKKEAGKQAIVQAKEETEIHPIVHFALGLQFYTHFTSPMRRMADILVHEILTKVLEGKNPKLIESEQIQKINNGRRSTKRLKKDLNEIYLCLMIHHTKKPIETEGIIASFGMESVSIYIPLFDMQKQVMWKKEFIIHSIKRIRNKDDRLDVKVKHDKKSSKGDVYWIMKKFEKVKLILGCTKSPPLRLTVEMEVQSEKGPYKIEWTDQ